MPRQTLIGIVFAAVIVISEITPVWMNQARVEFRVIDFGSSCDLGTRCKNPRFLALCIRHNPDLSVKFFVKKCVLYTRNKGNSYCDFKYLISLWMLKG